MLVTLDEMHISHGRRDVRMPGKVLDRPHVASGGRQTSAKRMAEAVKRDRLNLGRKAGRGERLVYPGQLRPGLRRRENPYRF